MKLWSSSHVVHPGCESRLAPIFEQQLVALQRRNRGDPGDSKPEFPRRLFNLRDKTTHGIRLSARYACVNQSPRASLNEECLVSCVLLCASRVSAIITQNRGGQSFHWRYRPIDLALSLHLWKRLLIRKQSNCAANIGVASATTAAQTS